MAEIEQLQLKLEAKDKIVDQKMSERDFDCKVVKPPTNYQCTKCSKYFNKKSSLVDHLTETACAGEKKMDWECVICSKMFTYRGLARHLTQFVINKHAPRGQHAKYDTHYHQTLLNDQKLKKSKNDHNC